MLSRRLSKLHNVCAESHGLSAAHTCRRPLPWRKVESASPAAGVMRVPACTLRWTGFARAQLPMELARTRLEMAYASAERSPEVAIAEGKAALEEFERLDAARYADAAGALLRSLGAPIRTGPKGVGALTRREAEVLQLIGAGLSNSRDWRSALHHPQDRRAPRRERVVQARPA